MSAVEPVHGWPRYCKFGCRCDVCSEAATEFRQTRYARLRAGRGREWMDDAACRELPTSVFFAPDADGSGFGRRWSPEQAQAVCAGCPVRDKCKVYAQAHHITDGVWGGVDRTGLRRRNERRR